MDSTGTRSGKSYKDCNICVITWSALSVFTVEMELYRDLGIIADITIEKLEWIVRMHHGRVVKMYLRGNGKKKKKKNAKTQIEMTG